ncbi:hypothetical protein BDFB_011047 [Asbolus verrucosus]|uniref:Cuticle 3 domain containing protein n=1 Tax=Asbolus verrucosus TaxID=1661398 RepID=A0A482VVM7_ASBVE|nr:hypothetical protein BDFB_011047 [Asbolus verrucosus]
MLKLVVLSVLVVSIAAKPSGLVGAHLGYSAVAAPAVAVPAAVSHQFRTDVISKPFVTTYAAAPVLQKAVVAASPAVYAAPVVQKAVVAAPVSVSAAITHQSRVDLHPTVVAAPVAYAAHVPAVHAAHASAVHAW